MPVSLTRDPFSGVFVRPNDKIRTPQARILAALMPPYPEDPPFEWPLFSRAGLGIRAGYTSISGTVTRALSGIRAGSTSGDPYPGLLIRGLVETVVLDIEGTLETNYRITASGIKAYQTWLAAGGRIPPVREVALCTNNRYKIGGTPNKGATET